MDFITFCRFGREEHWRKDRIIFLKQLRNLITVLAPYEDRELYKTANETEITKSLKEIFKTRKKNFDSLSYEFIRLFICHMGISYDLLSKKEKEDIFEMEFTYENWKNKSEELYNNYLKRSEKICPKEIHFCLYYRYFLMYVQIEKRSELSANNFLTFIRDFFLLEKVKTFEGFIKPEEFNCIKKQVIDLYPELKEKYGNNRVLDKFLSYIDCDNDYNYEITKNILDNYYNNKKKKKGGEETVRLKDKED